MNTETKEQIYTVNDGIVLIPVEGLPNDDIRGWRSEVDGLWVGRRQIKEDVTVTCPLKVGDTITGVEEVDTGALPIRMTAPIQTYQVTGIRVEEADNAFDYQCDACDRVYDHDQGAIDCHGDTTSMIEKAQFSFKLQVKVKE